MKGFESVLDTKRHIINIYFTLFCQVVLHRLSWQKVWSLPPLSEEARVKAMSWRPDGKGEIIEL